jgi:hypothetical protein
MYEQKAKPAPCPFSTAWITIRASAIAQKNSLAGEAEREQVQREE